MVDLKKHGDFKGRYFDTGTICNALACWGVQAPHTKEPYSEALLLGVSGGITFGYFVFQYKGWPPHVALMTRNTFSPFQTILDRLGIVQDLHETKQPDKGMTNLVDALESGSPAIVWADTFSLSYNQSPPVKDIWAMMPLLVHDYDGKAFEVADRSRISFRVTADELMAARGRVKKDRYRVVTLSPPDKAKLAEAVEAGIRQCISLFCNGFPRGGKDSFGFNAYQKWADMLVNSRNKQSWVRVFSSGANIYQALAGSVYLPGVFGWIMLFGGTPGAGRGMFADFLDEATQILKRAKLGAVAKEFRKSQDLWQNLAEAAVPPTVALLQNARDLLTRRSELFFEEGQTAIEEIREIQTRLNENGTAAKTLDPSSEAFHEIRLDLHERVLEIRDLERSAIDALRNAI